MKINNLIKDARLKKGYTMKELADAIGVSEGTISRWESGRISNMKRDKIAILSKVLDLSIEELMEWTSNEDLAHYKYSELKGLTYGELKLKSNLPKISSVRIPVLGRVAAGIPLDAIEEIIDWEEIPQEMAKDGEYFGLKIKGNSMSPRIQNGDVVIVRKQDDADTDDIVIALVNGNEGCCKKLKKTNTGIMLISFNPAYEPMVFDKSEIDCIPVRIIGKVVELRGKF